MLWTCGGGRSTGDRCNLLLLLPPSISSCSRVHTGVIITTLSHSPQIDIVVVVSAENCNCSQCRYIKQIVLTLLSVLFRTHRTHTLTHFTERTRWIYPVFDKEASGPPQYEDDVNNDHYEIHLSSYHLPGLEVPQLLATLSCRLVIS